MLSKLILTTTKGMSKEDWHAFRSRGIGASESSTILGLNPYKSSVQLFYEKIGQQPIFDFENIAKFLGREQEDFIAKMWEAWEGTPDSVIKNWNAGRAVRRCQRVNYYVQNPDYPQLFTSLDRKINKNADGEEGALEIKTISSDEARKWESGIPPGYIIQLQHEIHVCEFSFGELGVLKDGRHLMVYPFERNKTITDHLEAVTKFFWNNVIAARVLVTKQYEAQRTFNMKLARECEAAIANLEPPIDGTQSYQAYLNERYTETLDKSAGSRRGSESEFEIASRHKELVGRIKELEELARVEENTLKKALGNFVKLDFGGKGAVTWYGDKEGTRRFYNKIKDY